MKKLNENQKITLTLGQLKRLVTESYSDDVVSKMYSNWVEFINKFGVEQTAKILSYKNSSGTYGVDLCDTLANYVEDGDPPSDVSYLIDKAAEEKGLTRDATDLYTTYCASKYEKFLVDSGNGGFSSFRGYDAISDLGSYELQDLVDKLLETNEKVYVVVHEELDEDMADENDLDWDSALTAVDSEYDVVNTGTVASGDYMIAVER